MKISPSSNIAAELGEQVLHQARHRGDVDRQRGLGLRDQPAITVADRGRMIAALLDVGRIGAFHQRDKGFVGDRPQAVRR